MSAHTDVLQGTFLLGMETVFNEKNAVGLNSEAGCDFSFLWKNVFHCHCLKKELLQKSHQSFHSPEMLSVFSSSLYLGKVHSFPIICFVLQLNSTYFFSNRHSPH